jgi:hypothetical protein
VLCQGAGIEAVYAPGEGIDADGVPGSHGWNAVKIRGKWYMLDVTWDDPVMESGEQRLGYDYFLVTSRQLAQDHIWDQGQYPDCTATEFSAQTVRDFAAGDQTEYTRWDASRLVTAREAEEEFTAGLLRCRPALPEAAPPETQPPETPPPQTQPPATRPQNPQNPTVPGPTIPEGKGPNLGWILGVVVVLILAAGVVVIRHLGNRPRTRRPAPPKHRHKPTRMPTSRPHSRR